MALTDTNLWQNNAVTQQPKWENIAKIISHFIRHTDSVLDLGAGDRKLKKYIPESCNYIPVDCTGALPGTYIVDFNKEFHLPKQDFNVIVSAGFVEYLSDLDAFLMKLSTECSGIYFLFTYSYSKNRTVKAFKKKKCYNKLNAIRDSEEAIQLFSRYTEHLYEIVKLKNQSLFSGVLSAKPQANVIPQITINEVVKRQPIWKRLKIIG
jgi:hypothetical protein